MKGTGIGKRLKLARERQGLLGGDVAARMGCNVRTLYRWERGEFEPSISTLSRLADLYGVTMVYLITGEENGNAALGLCHAAWLPPATTTSRVSEGTSHA